MRAALLLALLLAPPAAVAQSAGPGTEAVQLVVVSSAGVAGSVLFLGASAATDEIAFAVLSPLAAAGGAYAAAEAVGTDQTVLHALQGAFIGAGLAVVLAVSTDDGNRRFAYVATLPALGAAVNLRVGGPILYRTPAGGLAPGWSLPVRL